MKENRFKLIICIVLLILGVSGFLLQSGFMGSSFIASCNGGYGAFNYWTYDYKMFVSAMNANSEMRIYVPYYVCDFIFNLSMGFLMLVLTLFVIGNYKIIKYVGYLVVLIRTICCVVENIILLSAIGNYLKVEAVTISIANTFTRLSIILLLVWSLIIFVTFIYRMIKINKEDKYSVKKK